MIGTILNSTADDSTAGNRTAGGRRAGLGLVAAVVTLATVTACGGAGGGKTDAKAADKKPGGASAPAATTPSDALGVQRGPAAAGGGGAACVFVKPDGAQKFGHVGWGFKIPGTGRWVYGAVENPSDKLYTPPGGYIGAWDAEGSRRQMLHDMAWDTHYPGRSKFPYTRYRCRTTPTGDVAAARVMIRKVAARGFLVGVDPRTGKFGSRDCLDATHDVLRAYRTRNLPYAHPAQIPNVWVASLVGWSDRRLTR